MRKIKWVITEVLLKWPMVAWAVLACIMYLFISKRINIANIKAWEFEVSFEKKVKELGLEKTSEFEHLRNLSEDELKLFLIMGGKEASSYVFTDRGMTKAVSEERYKKLSNDSLIRFTLKHHENGIDTTITSPTEVGEQLHRVLVQSLYFQLMQ
ncbi:MAG TPA: hypothetical protein VNV35_05685 [Puia sp.]|nr:hypothetical protein [Puia sp.]